MYNGTTDNSNIAIVLYIDKSIYNIVKQWKKNHSPHSISMYLFRILVVVVLKQDRVLILYACV